MKEKYHYTYREGENPIERIRNKLSSYFTLLSIIRGGKKTANTDTIIENCAAEKEDIIKIIKDIEIDLNGKV